MKNLWGELEKYSASDYYPFHMPGHKRLPEEVVLACYKRFLEESAMTLNKRLPEEVVLTLHKRGLKDLYRYDITEIEGFDNLHHAKGLLLELQQKAACVYHAEESCFLVNGSTGGILSAISAVAKEGKTLLIARNCHKSVYHAVELNRLQAEYLWPEWIEDFDITGEILAKQVKEHLAKRQDICGVVITSPTYEGVISDMEEIAKAVHACQIPLIVDEAHGAHFVLSKKAPKGAAECGADIVINSVHKTLPALTQTALLHMQGTLVDRERLKRYLRIYQSSSPSYLLMASIDSCVDFIAEQGRESYERLLRFRKRIDESAAKFSGIRILLSDGKRSDVGKLVISVKGTGMTGPELYRTLLEKYHLQMEMAASNYVLGIVTVMDTEEGIKRLIDALEEIDDTLSENGKTEKKIKKAEREDDIYHRKAVASGLRIDEAMRQEKEWIYLKEAAERVSGGFLSCYPPGIPFLVPGEFISKELLFKIVQEQEKGRNFTGMNEEGKVCVLKK